MPSWGNPIRQNGTPEPNTQLNTSMTISNVTIKERDYAVCNSIFVKYDPVICSNESIVEVGIFGNTQGYPAHQVKMININTSPNLSAAFHKNEPWVVSNLITLTVIQTNQTQTGFFEIVYKDECTGATNTLRRQVKIESNATPCPVEGCSSNTPDYKCCPEGTFYDGFNCFYGKVPDGYQPFIFNNSFYVTPNLTISTENHGCPIGYWWDTANCHSGLNFPTGYEGFIYDNGFYVEPSCRNERDCCPPGNYIYDEIDCKAGLSIPSGYEGFIYENQFYVRPNCSISNANSCCPPGYTHDGVNCYSAIGFPQGFSAYISEGKFYVIPNCSWWEEHFSPNPEDRNSQSQNIFVSGELKNGCILFPNPISPGDQQISFFCDNIEYVYWVKIYNTKGELITNFDLAQFSSAFHDISLPVNLTANEIYIVQLMTSNGIITKKLHSGF